MMCQSSGRPPISPMGLGRTCVSSLIRVPSPPARITAFMPIAYWKTPGARASCAEPRIVLYADEARRVAAQRRDRLLRAQVTREQVPRGLAGLRVRIDRRPARDLVALAREHWPIVHAQIEHAAADPGRRIERVGHACD